MGLSAFMSSLVSPLCEQNHQWPFIVSLFFQQTNPTVYLDAGKEQASNLFCSIDALDPFLASNTLVQLTNSHAHHHSEAVSWSV